MKQHFPSRPLGPSQKPSAGRRIFAVFACLILLYFGAGGGFLHQHKAGQETCHVCQSAHAPAIGTAMVSMPTLADSARFASAAPAIFVATLFARHYAGRAPPSLLA